jgi:hypothetical protein
MPRNKSGHTGAVLPEPSIFLAVTIHALIQIFRIESLLAETLINSRTECVMSSEVAHLL